jgi:hypothetical protein
MLLAGSRFSSDSAPRPFHHGIRGSGGTIFTDDDTVLIFKEHDNALVPVPTPEPRYAPGHLVEYDDVRALLGVLSGERDASKGIITTTSDFPPRVLEDPLIAPFIPTRLELMNREALQKWLLELAAQK